MANHRSPKPGLQVRVLPLPFQPFRKPPLEVTSLKDLVDFFKDSYNELKQVHWLTKKEMAASTSVVIIVVLAMSIFVMIIDFIIGNIVPFALRH